MCTKKSELPEQMREIVKPFNSRSLHNLPIIYTMRIPSQNYPIEICNLNFVGSSSEHIVGKSTRFVHWY